MQELNNDAIAAHVVNWLRDNNLSDYVIKHKDMHTVYHIHFLNFNTAFSRDSVGSIML